MIRLKKKFKDLKKGDSVWIISRDELTEHTILKIKETYLSCLIINAGCSEYPVLYIRIKNKYRKRAGNIFTMKEEVVRCLKERMRKRMGVLEKKIGKLVSEFDLLDSICQPSTVKPSTKPLSMKELKPGDSVWVVRKDEMEVKEAKITKTGVCYNYIVVDTSLYAFHAFPNSKCSLNALYYTGEEQAWRYMLKWKKSRMRTVGKEMEKLMRELERYEKVWRSD